jgi:hypothetical protein
LKGCGLGGKSQDAFRSLREVAIAFYGSSKKISVNIRNFTMTIRDIAVSVGALIIALASQGAPAQALSLKECSAKYKAAKVAGTLNGMKWNEFRKAQCATEAEAPPTAPPPAETPSSKPAVKPARTPAPAATANAVFPSAVSPKYSSESAGKARMHTCLDQYRVNKANGGNGALKWIEKGGGYYSECNKRLKGQA